jgi:hypothetical protein
VDWVKEQVLSKTLKLLIRQVKRKTNKQRLDHVLKFEFTGRTKIKFYFVECAENDIVGKYMVLYELKFVYKM